MASGLLLILASIQGASAEELRNLSNKFKTEAGCPVDLVSAKTDLEIDPFGTPIACRIYIDYKNTGEKQLAGVKFRIGYIDADEKVRGTFHAPDSHIVEPGATAKAKWRGEHVDPRTSYIMIRVLVAKYSDGSEWDSEKLKDLAPGTGGQGNSAPEQSNAAPADNSAGATQTGNSSGY